MLNFLSETPVPHMKSLRRVCGLVAVAGVLSALAPATCGAAEIASSWADEQQASVRLIAARDGLGADGVVRAGLEFQLQPGWKIYWRSPGDAGFPPQPDFAESRNVDVGPLEWPVPERFSVIGLETLGYEDAVVLPFTIKAIDTNQPALVAGTVRYLACKDICIPYDAAISMTVPVGGGAPTALAHTIGRFESQIPSTPAAARMDVAELWTEASTKGLYVVARATSEIPFKNPDLYIEGPTSLGYGAPAVRLGDGGREAVLRIPVSGFAAPPDVAANALSGQRFTLTLRDGMRAAETVRDAGSARPFSPDALAKATANTIPHTLAVILLFAFLGGLILNLMPCVLPVLSIKFLSLLKHGNSTRGHVRASFLASAAGIVFAFLLLASALIGLKSAGAGVGWGIQFQQPWFLIGMAFLVTLFACNLWGFFEVRLPSAVADASHRGGARGGIIGHFLQGIFATLLATPCSAPFLGTAVGFALSSGTPEIIGVFSFLGLGMATPYLLVAAIPGLATMMPKPGPWMVKLKIALGVALAATALWLLSVIAGVVSTGQAVLTGLILIGVAVWLGPVMRLVPEIRRATPFILVFATLASITGAYVGGIDEPLDPQTPGLTRIAWQKFDPDILAEMTDKGLIVFVDVTADWCITCQVNKRLVLEQGRLLELLNSHDVIPMQADWTRPDPDIAAYLASFGRYGIPFNAVYGPRAPHGVALPELLSERAVLDGFSAAVPESLIPRFK